MDWTGRKVLVTGAGGFIGSHLAERMLGLGADVAFVGSQRGDQFRISARASQVLVRKGLHLGKLLGSVGSETTNGGGGHPGAAGITGVGDVEAILNICAENALKILRSIGSSRD